MRAMMARTAMDLLNERLAAQCITPSAFAAPRDVVGWLGAMQGQDYAGTKWAVALRCSNDRVAESDVERALSEGSILRTHLMRWTWQLVLPRDVRWMTALVAPRLIARVASRYRALGLDDTTIRKSNTLLDKATRDGRSRSRDELAELLERAGISTEKERLSHLLGRAEMDGILCSGPRRGKQFTFAHLDDRAPPAGRAPPRDASLAELARRYFRSRGPATLADFVWWSGLTVADARTGIDGIRPSLVSERRGSVTYLHSEERPPMRPRSTARTRAEPRDAVLLPPFDEYIVAYRRREELLDARQARRLNAGGGMLNPAVAIGGKVIGTWRRELAPNAVVIAIDLFEAPSATQRQGITRAAERYAAYLGLEARIARIARKK
jgi:hypothetical protein